MYVALGSVESVDPSEQHVLTEREAEAQRHKRTQGADPPRCPVSQARALHCFREPAALPVAGVYLGKG